MLKRKHGLPGGERLKRRHLVQEVASWIGYTGSTWAVGCTTNESALRAFDRRAIRSSLDEGEVGHILVYDREQGEVLAWSSETARLWYSAPRFQKPVEGDLD
jgi:hypothetical protein